MKKRAYLIGLSVVVVAMAVPSFAQAQQSVVERAKADLAAAGVPVEHAACTDFEIAKVVAGRVPGAGLLTKDCCGDGSDPNRSHCEFNGVWYAHDIVAFADGTLVDIAQDGGGANGPTWQVADPDPALIGRYRSAAALGLTGRVPGASTPVPVPPPAPNPLPTTSNLQPVLDAIAALQNTVNALNQAVAAIAAKPDPVITLPPFELPAQKCVRGKFSYLGSVTLCPVQ